MLFHTFSMAGWMLFGVMLRNMAQSSCAARLSDICGLVVDSAPQTTVPALPPQKQKIKSNIISKSDKPKHL